MGLKEKCEKSGLNSTFKKLRSWHLVPSPHGKWLGKKWKQWQIFFSWAPKSLWMVTAAMNSKDPCSLKGNLWQTFRGLICFIISILKRRDITLPTKVHFVKAMVLPVVMYGCENWIIKKAECQRIDVFELWTWRRLLKVPWNVQRPNQPILRNSNPEYSLKGLFLKLKFQYFGHLGKTEGKRRKGGREWDC